MIQTQYTMEVNDIRLRVREIALKQRLDPAKLSRKADLGYATVLKIWAGKTMNPGYTTLQKLAIALGVSIADLIDEESSDQ
jgi:transcriptional regulator with XRE-family HTH domain